MSASYFWEANHCGNKGVGIVCSRSYHPMSKSKGASNTQRRCSMSFAEVLAAYEANEIDDIDAVELSGCFSIIELYEQVADEEETALKSEVVYLRHHAARLRTRET